MTSTRIRQKGRAAAAVAVVLLLPLHAHAQDRARAAEPDSRCEALLQRAVAELAAEQYPTMLKVAEDRMLLCADPVSSFLVGLAQANLVDSLALSDPGQQEQVRRKALRNLRIAAAGAAALPPRWQYTAHEWIVYLQELGGPLIEVPDREDADFSDRPVYELTHYDSSSPQDIPPAPPPQPQPRFPWGPLLTGVAGLGALTTGIVLTADASNKRDEAQAAAAELLTLVHDGTSDKEQVRQWTEQTRELQQDASTEARWGTGLLIGGGAALGVSVLWYWLVPPEGKWRWAVTPTSVQTTVRF